MKYSHNHFESRFFLFGMEVNGDTAAVVLHGDAVVFVD